MKRLIIRENSRWMAYYEIFITLLVAYSCIETMYIFSFNISVEGDHKIFDILVEVFFAIDMLLNFLKEYKDPETYENVWSF